MRSFGSDNNSGIHPQILDAIISANIDHAIGYGGDSWTAEADQQLKSIFGEDAGIYYVFNGTGANVVALQAATRPFNSIITAQTGHINVDECGAPIKFTGCALIDIPTKDGKLTIDLIASQLHGFGDQHHSQPKVVYLSQSTELGTVYTQEELKAICNYAHQNGMYVHLDGARLSNACAHLGLNMKELTVDCGVDILSLGGTKNGMMIGEAVISFCPELSEFMKFYRKQSAQLSSKMRYLSAQFTAYFKNDLWMENATHSNQMALLLYERIKGIKNIQFTQVVQANALFICMPEDMIRQLQKQFFFYVWNETENEIRLVCSWDTKKEDVEILAEAIEKLAQA